MTDDKITTQGVHHVGLTVFNLNEAIDFFVEVLNYKLLGSREEYPAAFVTDGVTMITLWQAAQPDTAIGFDRVNHIGLHHLAISVANVDELSRLYKRLQNTANVIIEFAPQLQGSGANTHMMCNIPSGIRVEFIAPTH